MFQTIPPGWCDVDALIVRLEMRLHVSDLNRSDLRAIRKAGGEYTEARGHNDYMRFVSLSPESTELFDRLMACVVRTGRNWGDRYLICRGPVERFGGLHIGIDPKKPFTIAGLLKAAERKARANGKPCTCCGLIIPNRESLNWCADCHHERGVYEKAARAAALAGYRYDLAERCLWAANGGVMAIYEVLEGTAS